MSIVQKSKHGMYPVRFGEVIIALGEIKVIYKIQHDESIMIQTFSGDNFIVKDMSLEQVEKCYLDAYKNSDF